MKRFCVLASLALSALSNHAGAQTNSSPRLTNGRPAIVVFFTAGCPHNPSGVKDINVLVDQLKRQYSVFGYTNLSQPDAEKYLKRLGAKFRIAGDVKGQQIAQWGGKHSLDMILLGANGKVIKRWEGYDRSVIASLGKLIPAATLDPKKFPAERQSGCGFPDPIR